MGIKPFIMIETTRYYDEFIKYFDLAKHQQDLCNVSLNPPYGMIAHEESDIPCDLMRNVHLYDVVERKYAGFSQIVNDCFYGWTEEHPYWKKMEAGVATRQREQVAKDWTGRQHVFDLPEWLYIFILHRVCGSAINYAQKPSGYFNTILFNLYRCDTIEDMVNLVKHYPVSFYTSVGYQFPAFPKPTKEYKKGGDYFLCEYVPKLAYELARFLETHGRKDLREIGDFMLNWNVDIDAIRLGILRVHTNTGFTGRWTVLNQSPLIICDTAHNKEGLSIVLKDISRIKYSKLHFVIGFVEDKELDSIIELFPKDAIYYFCKPEIKRGLSAIKLESIFESNSRFGSSFNSVNDALVSAKENSKESDLIYIGGSTFVVSEVI